MRDPRAAFVAVTVALLGATSLVGCDRIRELAPAVPSAAFVPGHNHNPRDHNVIPSHSPARTMTVVVEDERTVGSIARQLGTTVEETLQLNKMGSPEIKAGQTLTVRTSPEAYARFLANREVRKTRRAARQRHLAEKRKAAAMKAVQAAKKRKPRRSKRRRGKRRRKR